MNALLKKIITQRIPKIFLKISNILSINFANKKRIGGGNLQENLNENEFLC